MRHTQCGGFIETALPVRKRLDMDVNGGGDCVAHGAQCGGFIETALPVRKRLNHRGPWSIDVTGAWYFITICAAERIDYGRAVSMKPPPVAAPPFGIDGVPPASVDIPFGRAVSMKPPPTPFMIHAAEILDAARFRHIRGVWKLDLFLLMPDHIHLIAHFPNVAAVSSKPPYRGGMKYVISDFKRWLSTTYGIRFQRDFWDTRLRDDEQHAEKYRYICDNPVRKGLCSAASEWPHVMAFDRGTGAERMDR